MLAEASNLSGMDALFRIEMLGRFAVFEGNREISRFRTQKTASLLAYLALFRTRSHPRETLIACFWPDSALEAARTNLSVALNALRRQLEPPGVPAGAVLMADHNQVRLNPIAFTSDVDDFESLLRQARSASEPEQRAGLCRIALDLYRGDLLPGHYDDWILSERDRLREAYLATLRHVLKELAESRQFEAALIYAHRLVQADPLREESYRHLMRVYAALGRPGEALDHYEALERLLQKELQATPSSATRVLAEQLRQAAPKPYKPSKARAADIPLKEASIAAQPPVPETKRPVFKVPLQFTRFFGREEAIAQIAAALGVPAGDSQEGSSLPAASRSRLLTLTGPGGTGKTRLSVEVTGRLKEAFPGGIWFVPLAELNDPLLIGEALHDVLELPRQAKVPALEQVIAHLNSLEAPCLLILDNFEQITAGGASVVWTLLQQVALLQCLVSSRQPLSLPGEREIPLSPLPIPTTGGQALSDSLLTTHLLTYPSVALFVDRAQSARPDFQITARNAEAICAICQQLEGLPLAIELAAARIKTLTPVQMVDRLAERFALLAFQKSNKEERHRSLWAAIDWSYHLLNPDLQRLFARLSVFRGGWSLEAAETVCEEPLALDYLGQLRAHSLILAQESSEAIRFGMLESIREFAAEQLAEEERAETEQRHAAFFHSRIAAAQLFGPERTAWFARFEEDLDNLRAVLSWSLKGDKEIEIGLQMAGALVVFWRISGRLGEGQMWYTRLLEHAKETPTEGLAHSLYGAGALASLQGESETALPLLERCLKTAFFLEDDSFKAIAYNELGSIAYRRGDLEQARMHYEEYLALARERGTPAQQASAITNLAAVAQATGDFSTSRALNREGLRIWRAIEDRYGEARTLHNLANLARSEGQWAEARAYFEQSLAIKREFVRDGYGIGMSLAGLAEVATAQRDYGAAAIFALESLALAREQNARTELVGILHLLSELVRAIGELEISARMSGTLERVREEMRYPMTPVDQEEYDKSQTDLREALGTAVYAALKSEGRLLSLEQALAFLETMLANRSL